MKKIIYLLTFFLISSCCHADELPVKAPDSYMSHEQINTPEFQELCNLLMPLSCLAAMQQQNHQTTQPPQASVLPGRKLDNPNWGTHQVPLITVVVNTKGPILELGCGDFSTPILHALCTAEKRLL